MQEQSSELGGRPSREERQGLCRRLAENFEALLFHREVGFVGCLLALIDHALADRACASGEHAKVTHLLSHRQGYEAADVPPDVVERLATGVEAKAYAYVVRAQRALSACGRSRARRRRLAPS